MRIVWKDSRTYKTYKYRDYIIKKIPEGWITNIPGDDNIYYSAEHAHNAADKILGGHGQKGSAKRISYGIRIIGKKAGDHSCA